MHYDPLLAKLIAHADTREAAIARAINALRSLAVLGVKTNVPFLLNVLLDARFSAGKFDTGFIDRLVDELRVAAVTQRGGFGRGRLAPRVV